ncbi:MAG: histidinol-phosphate transaminase [SAR202 cluster bacterium]|nr:histidinol-phosphate transaminase [SAR202 cluster bacterium]
MPDFERLVRQHLKKVDTYASVDPTEELARSAGIRPEDVIRLNANENPYGPSETVKEAVAKAHLNIYPDPNQRKVRAALAAYTKQPEDRLVAGAGADELIDLLMRLFLERGDRVIDAVPTFGMYGFCARINDASVVSVERDESFDLDLEAIRRAVDPRTKIIFVCSPNNPTGNSVTEAQAVALLELGPVVVIDETYFEFAGTTLAHLVDRYENLVILRTFSKWAGVAGLRVGYMIASPGLVRHIFDIKPPYNINVAAEAAVLASLANPAPLLKNVRTLVAQRKRLEAELKHIQGIRYWPSDGNYLLCEFGREGKKVYEALGRRGIFVRHFSHPRLRRALRISAGTPEQTDRVIEAIKDESFELTGGRKTR